MDAATDAAHDLRCPELTDPLPSGPDPDRCTCRDEHGHHRPLRDRITAPGVYDLPADTYHADPVPGGSLSSSGARKLLPPSCPALFRHWADNGQAAKAEFDIGHAAHAEVLGVGAPLAVIDADDWRSKAAREARDAARADGATPVLVREHEQVQAMAAALRAHPVASAVFAPGRGSAEQTLIWRDKATGVWRRAMLDWLPHPSPGARVIVADYKTTRSAEPTGLPRSFATYGYAQQADWYLDGVTTLGLAGDVEPAFLFVFQEKDPPYLVTVAQPDPEALLWGRRLNRKAIDVYRRCTENSSWPGYTDEVISLSLPPWSVSQLDAAWQRGDLDPTYSKDTAA